MNRSTIVAVTAVALAACATSGPKQAANFVSQVEESRAILKATKVEIRSALAAAKALGRKKGGDLEAQYEAINSAVIQSGTKMVGFRKKLASMDETSESFFSGWSAELDEYTTAEFRKRSEARLKKTRRRYNRLRSTMQKAEAKFIPLWAKLHDLVLFLNYNLNAEGVASIGDSVRALGSEARKLYTRIDAAVQEADGFTKWMGP
ncbi:MAG: DUF2959 family protein [Nitrospiraceae bacterium]